MSSDEVNVALGKFEAQGQLLLKNLEDLKAHLEQVFASRNANPDW
jgi:hypothetical protein